MAFLLDNFSRLKAWIYVSKVYVLNNGAGVHVWDVYLQLAVATRLSPRLGAAMQCVSASLNLLLLFYYTLKLYYSLDPLR